jgi:hypothetical protein
MTRRPLALAAAFAAAGALAIPAVSLADDTGPSTAAAKPGGVRAGAVLRRIERRLDRRFKVFSAHCLVENAPDRCSKAADRFVTRLGRFQAALEKLKAKIAETCSATGAPARCARAEAATARIDELLGKIASDVAAIKAAYPDAGAASS